MMCPHCGYHEQRILAEYCQRCGKPLKAAPSGPEKEQENG